MKRHAYLSGLFIFLFFLFSCDNDTSSYFPYAAVNFRVSLNPGVHHTISEIQGYYEKTQKTGADEIGYGGVLVYHTIDDKFAGYDRVCPNELSRAYLISPPDDKGVVTCNHCGSEFDVLWLENKGRPIAGPALEKGRRLQYYPANKAGNEVIVSNRY